MKTFDAAIERLFEVVAERASERGILLLAASLYIGIGLALPLTLSWSTPWLVGANVMGTTLAFSFLTVWLAARVQESRRRNLLEWTTDLRRLNSSEFEWLVGELFRREGFIVEETGRADGADGGLDLRVTKGRDKLLVQCKRWTANIVGVEVVRSFAGVLAREGMPSKSGVLVTLSSFSEAAQADAKKLGLVLLDGPDLYSRVERVRTPKHCPRCKAPMVLDRSDFGWWFRCLVPGCNGKEDLGRHPGLAVDLLTQPPTR